MIKFIEMQCPKCGGNLKKTGRKIAKCKYCDTSFIIEDDKIIQITDERIRVNRNLIFFMSVIIIISIYVFVSSKEKHNAEPVRIAVEHTEQEEEYVMSELLQEFVKKVYGVGYEKVTPEQFEKITYLHIYCENRCIIIEYGMGNDNINKIQFPETLNCDTRGLSKFKGLQGLYLDNGILKDGDLEGMENILEVASVNTPEEFSSIIPHPDKIVSLGCYRTSSSLVGIDAFSGLEKLYLKSSELSDIRALSSLKNLKDLEIYKGDMIEDFNVISSMKNLERLALDSQSLKDISFVTGLEKLKEFSLEDSKVLDISPLGELNQITSVTLDDNTDIKDFSPLSRLSNLNLLSLDLGSVKECPSVQNWTNLRSLTIRCASDISFLDSLPELENLSILASDCSAFDVLQELTKLQTLKFENIYGDIPNLESLNRMENLKSLDISSLSLNGNVESVFAIPNLEELNMSECTVGIDFSNVTENNSLKKLNMDRITIMTSISVEYDGPFTYLDYDKVALDEEISFLNKFPNIEELYLAGNKLTNVNFTESLTKLKMLDISDNYITDLSPLSKLRDLQVVWCADNSISQGLDLGEDVIVVTKAGIWED